jgi:CMP-N,N'-diacetyllegionaminic acid synthase
MIDNQKILGLITARGGSKGVLRKNLREVAGKPLIGWTIEAAAGSRYLDRLILSSEDEEIIACARRLNCEAPFVRPTELADDRATSISVVHHALNSLVERYDYLVLLQPTSPLRSAEDIDACIAACIAARAPSCVSVTEVTKPPQWMYTRKPDGRMIPFVPTEQRLGRRQDATPLHVLNGAVFVARCDWILGRLDFIAEDTIAYEMPPERSFDVDSEMDLRIVKALIEAVQ